MTNTMISQCGPSHVVVVFKGSKRLWRCCGVEGVIVIYSQPFLAFGGTFPDTFMNRLIYACTKNLHSED